MLYNLLHTLFDSSAAARKLRKAVYAITRITPHNLSLYKLAFQHSSMPDATYSNERLEFLGDAVLSLIIGEYLFKKYPLKEEGFLTEIRARIVNRASLGKLAKQVGVDTLVQYHRSARNRGGFKFVYGNALEALIGAVYLDRGYHHCRTFVLTQLISAHIDLEALIENDTNYKSQLITWANRNRKKVHFQIIQEQQMGGNREFTAQAKLDSEVIGQGQGRSKKQAEQQAAYSALMEYASQPHQPLGSVHTE